MDKFTIKHDIKGFHVLLDITGDYMFTTDAKDKADSIVQALEKQIPQQVVRRDTGEIDVYTGYYCPRCNSVVVADHCRCGQLLSWEE